MLCCKVCPSQKNSWFQVKQSLKVHSIHKKMFIFHVTVANLKWRSWTGTAPGEEGAMGKLMGNACPQLLGIEMFRARAAHSLVVVWWISRASVSAGDPHRFIPLLLPFTLLIHPCCQLTQTNWLSIITTLSSSSKPSFLHVFVFFFFPAFQPVTCLKLNTCLYTLPEPALELPRLFSTLCSVIASLLPPKHMIIQLLYLC